MFIKMAIKIIVIQGNIGSGKSTFVENLKVKYGNNPEMCFLQEPVSEWLKIKDEKGVNILENYYADQHKYSFMFQMMAYISRLSILKKAVESGKYKYIITERCLNTDRNVFCKMLYHDGYIDRMGYTIYNKWFDEFNTFNIEVEYFHMYIRTDPYISKSRVDKRARKEESIPIEYLIKCHEYHEDWLIDDSNETLYVTIIDGNQNIVTNPDISLWYSDFEFILSID
jgi:deoxycitidine kinase/deoxyguanosine kinase